MLGLISHGFRGNITKTRQSPLFSTKGNNYNNIKQKKLILLRGRLTDINQYLHTKL
jgi:hypothetical protein